MSVLKNFHLIKIPFLLISEADRVDRVFEQCNSLHENQGLSLAEVQHEDCQGILNMAGFQSETLHETFKRFDMNGDGFVTKAEARKMQR